MKSKLFRDSKFYQPRTLAEVAAAGDGCPRCGKPLTLTEKRRGVFCAEHRPKGAA